MSLTKTSRPIMLALLGLLVVLAVLRPIGPSAASDGDAGADAETVITESTTTTTVVEETTTTVPGGDDSDGGDDAVISDDATDDEANDDEATDEDPADENTDDSSGDDAPEPQVDDEDEPGDDADEAVVDEDLKPADEPVAEVSGGGKTKTKTKTKSEPAQIDLVKTIVSGPVVDGSGAFEITYQLVVTNTGGEGKYTLEDALYFGGGITITSAQATNTVPGTIPTNGSWNGGDKQVIASSKNIEADTSHTYRVVVKGQITPGLTSDSGDCDTTTGSFETGFLNGALVTSDELQQAWDAACAEVPEAEIRVSKRATSGPIYNAAGNYELTYDIVVTNDGAAAGQYDLADRIMFGGDITVVAASIENIDPGTIAIDPTWNGTSRHQVALGVPIGAGESHTYRVSVEAAVAPGITEEAGDCVLDHGEEGTGFLNKALIRVDGEDSNDFDCREVPGPTISVAKSVVSGPTPNASGNYDISYQVTVSNTGQGPGSYDLRDELAYGDGITVVAASVANTAPGSVATNAAWNGIGDTTVATGVAIAPLTDHTYTVTVEAAVAATTSSAARDCTLGQDEDGTGLLNTATIVVDGVATSDDDCAEVPGPGWELTKSLTSGPTLNGSGTYDVSYEIVVTNTGEGPGSYDLDDAITFGDGITVVAASVANTAPGSVATSATWDGMSDTRVATAVGVAAGATHRYVITVEADVAVGVTAAAGDCTLGQGEDGTGFLNTATLTFDGGTLHDDDCAEVPDAELVLVKDLTAVTPNGDGTATVEYRIQVTNTGDGPTPYDLSDELRFGEGISVVSASVANDAPGGIVVNPAWDGLTDLVVATGVGIAAGDTHSYLVEVLAIVADDITGTAGDCELASGEEGTGYLNTATVTYDGGTLEDEDCAPVIVGDVDDDPTLEVTLAAYCDNDTPWLGYDIVGTESLAGLPATVTFSSEGRSAAYIVEQGAGALLWPGAEIDANGDPIDWPGWDVDEAGNWYLNPDNPYAWARGQVQVTVEVNPTYGPVTLTYPPAEPECDPAPPTDGDPDDDDPDGDPDDDDPDGDTPDDDTPNGDDDTPSGDDDLPFTGLPTGLFGGIGLAMLAAGTIVLRTVRRKQEDV